MPTASRTLRTQSFVHLFIANQDCAVGSLVVLKSVVLHVEKKG